MNNSYEMLELLRDNLGELVEKHWTDKLLLRRLNVDYKEVAKRVLDSPGDWLLKKSEAITASSGLITLPSDCVRVAYVEEVSSGRPIPLRGTVRERRLRRGIGSSLSAGEVEAYFLGANIEVNMEGYGEAVYVWYQPRIVDLAAGVCGTSTGATAVVLEAAQWPSGVNDYYNGIVIQVRDASDNLLNVNEAISDYVGLTLTATIASPLATPASGDFYGTVPQLPEELHNWIVLRATVNALSKPSSTFEKEIFSFWRAELKDVEEEALSFLATRFSGSTYTRIAE
jgi:hypothetical protein